MLATTMSSCRQILGCTNLLKSNWRKNTTESSQSPQTPIWDYIIQTTLMSTVNCSTTKINLDNHILEIVRCYDFAKQILRVNLMQIWYDYPGTGSQRNLLAHNILKENRFQSCQLLPIVSFWTSSKFDTAFNTCATHLSLFESDAFLVFLIFLKVMLNSGWS